MTIFCLNKRHNNYVNVYIISHNVACTLGFGNDIFVHKFSPAFYVLDIKLEAFYDLQTHK